MRSRLSPGGGQNQKVHFKAKTGTLFIISYKLGANHVKSYKKLDRKAQNLEITSFTIEIGAKIERFYQNSAILFKAQYVCDFNIKKPIQHSLIERGDQDVSKYV